MPELSLNVKVVMVVIVNFGTGFDTLSNVLTYFVTRTLVHDQNDYSAVFEG